MSVDWDDQAARRKAINALPRVANIAQAHQRLQFITPALREIITHNCSTDTGHQIMQALEDVSLWLEREFRQ